MLCHCFQFPANLPRLAATLALTNFANVTVNFQCASSDTCHAQPQRPSARSHLNEWFRMLSWGQDRVRGTTSPTPSLLTMPFREPTTTDINLNNLSILVKLQRRVCPSASLTKTAFGRGDQLILNVFSYLDYNFWGQGPPPRPLLNNFLSSPSLSSSMVDSCNKGSFIIVATHTF